MGAQDFPHDPLLEAEDNGWQCNVEAERSVIGSLLLDNSAWDRIADVTVESDFYLRSHRVLFRTVVQIIENNLPADALTVAEALDRARQLDEVGGHAYLGELVVSTPTVVHVRRYAEIVAERAMIRHLFATGMKLAETARYSKNRPVRDLVDEAQASVMAINGARHGQGSVFSDTTRILTRVVEEIDQQFARHEAGNDTGLTGVTTGFLDLDRMTTGLQPGQLVVLAARPSMGKSAMALNIMEAVAQSTRETVALFSLEMSEREMGFRMIASIGQINVQRLFTGRLQQNEWPKITDAIGRLQDLPILINESGGLSVTEIRAMCRRLKRERGSLALVVVDYLQLMVGGDSEANRAAQVSEISRGLKLLAKELKCPVIALSQLNRSVESRTNKRPMMSDLRESGSIEQDADMILFIYRDEVYDPKSAERGVAEVIVAKQRNGPTGVVRLAFRSDATRFCDLAEF